MRSHISLFIAVLASTTLLLGRPPNLSVKVGGPLASAQIMLGSRSAAGRTLVPTLGFGLLSVSTKTSSNDEGGRESSDAAFRLFLPRAGVRIVGPQVSNLRTYLALEAFMLIPLVSGSDFSDRDKESIRDELDLLGLTVGYGSEYFFAPQFSLGGEVSLSWVYWDENYESESGSFSRESRAIIAATMTRATLNFYFK